MRDRRGIARLAEVTCALLVLLLSPLGAAAIAAERVALVVGNGAYAEAPLENPVNDARLMAATLRDLEFQVVLVEDGSRTAMLEAAGAFRSALQPDSLALVYFAGHALQYRGVNYLLPIDFAAGAPDELEGHALRADALLDAMHAARVELALAILDACRNNPFGDPAEALGPGLAPIDRAQGETVVAYATAAGDVAEDGEIGNSPFTAALVTALEQPGLELHEVLRRVRGAVREATSGRQLPWVSGSVERPIVLNTHLPTAAADRTDGPAVYWNTIANSRNPADFEAFLRVAATAPEAPLARDRYEQLLRGDAPTTPLPVFRIAVADAPEGGLLAAQTPCDIVASAPSDPYRVAPAVEQAAVNTRLAIRLCAEALAREPRNPRLAFLLGRALQIAGRYAEAKALYESASAVGYAAATANLAGIHRSGLVDAPDMTKAAELYRRAVAQGSIAARNALGVMYRAGWGVPKSAEEGFLWTRLAADDGWPNAIDTLGTLFLRGEGVAQDASQAFVLFSKAAALGSSNAMNNVARMLRVGNGVEIDLDQSVTWFKRAIEAGNAYAPYELGRMYRRGWHLERDPRHAVALFKLAADRGFVEAYTEIAEMYETGDGVTADPVEAYYYFDLSAKAGRLREATFSHPPAEAGLARLADTLGAEQRAAVAERVAEELRLRGFVPPKAPI